MVFSKYNIFGQLKDSKNYFLVNLLTGNADILGEEKAREIIQKSYTDINEYIEKGYLVDETEEAKLYKRKYLEFLDKRDKEELQIFFVSNYTCNFNCSYCYQHEYQWYNQNLNTGIIDAFFHYVDTEFANRPKYITLFGGEPLLNQDEHRKMIEYFILKAKERELSLAVVTNGYYLMEYIPALKKGNIREIQVTLDGTKEVHDRRRYLKNQKGTFDKIVRGIDAALIENIPINLRVVVDGENSHQLIDLAHFAINKGWTKNPLFKTQLGRNYNLHTCQADSEKLYTRIELYEMLYTLIQQYPEFLEFHRPAYSISRYLFDQGELPQPLFDACPGCKSEWAFDYQGKIYPCTATVGKQEESVGTFFPEVTKDQEAIFHWQDRDVTAITTCRTCNLQFSCGGGCASMAKNTSGHLHTPDCRPVKELLALGISLYFPEKRS